VAHIPNVRHGHYFRGRSEFEFVRCCVIPSTIVAVINVITVVLIRVATSRGVLYLVASNSGPSLASSFIAVRLLPFLLDNLRHRLDEFLMGNALLGTGFLGEGHRNGLGVDWSAGLS
jgi:hypothetical protein